VKLDVRTFDLMGNEIKHTGTVRVTDSPMYLRFKGKSEAFVRALNEAAVTVVKEPVKPAEAKPAAAPAPKKMEDFAQAKEFGEARLIALDLKDTVNMGLADDKASDGVGGWTDEGPFNDMRDLKPGKHNWLGVPFVVIDPKANGGKAVLTLKGNTFPSGPAKGPTIPVGRKVEGFFFAHAANYAQVKGAPAGAYTVTYEDGKTQTAPIVIGSNVYDWWNDWQDGEDSRTVAVRAPDALGGKDQDRFIRIWYWKNPRPEQPVKSIMMATQPGSPAAMVLVAITAGVK